MSHLIENVLTFEKHILLREFLARVDFVYPTVHTTRPVFVQMRVSYYVSITLSIALHACYSCDICEGRI